MQTVFEMLAMDLLKEISKMIHAAESRSGCNVGKYCLGLEDATKIQGRPIGEDYLNEFFVSCYFCGKVISSNDINGIWRVNESTFEIIYNANREKKDIPFSERKKMQQELAANRKSLAHIRGVLKGGKLKGRKKK